MDWRCRESEGKVKIEGYMSISDEEAHQRMAPVMMSRCVGGNRHSNFLGCQF